MARQPFRQLMLHLFAVAGWLIGVLLIWPHSRVASVGLAVGGACALWLTTARHRRATDTPPLSPQHAKKQAQLVVTRMLGSLTRVQVAYLSQDFSSDAEARDWLRRTLPREFSPVLDRLGDDLEAARHDEWPEGLDLARRVIELRPELDRMDAALKKAHAQRPDHAVASPVVFVITEHIDAADASSEPLVLTLASVDPARPTLLATVDTVSIFSQRDNAREIRGHVDFDAARQALKLHRVHVDDRDARVYAVLPIGDPAALDLKLTRPPLGFVISGSEFV